MTSSERTDLPTNGASTAEAGVGRDEYETAELRRQNEALKRELAEVLEQQTATRDILRVISSSPTDLRAVFNAMAATAARACRAQDAIVMQIENDSLKVVSHYGLIGSTTKPEGTGLGLALTKRFVEMHGGRIWVRSEVWKG